MQDQNVKKGVLKLMCITIAKQWRIVQRIVFLHQVNH